MMDVLKPYTAGRRPRGHLRKIAPRRFNPSGDVCLPILHRAADGWEMTAPFSITALAHQLKRTDDWVVVDLSLPSER